MSDVNAAIATGRVPEGVSANYLKQSRDGSAIGAITFVCVLTVVVVVSRCASRLFIVKFFGIDDALALAGLVSAINLLLPGKNKLQGAIGSIDCLRGAQYRPHPLGIRSSL